MLVEFRVENYKSLVEEAIFPMLAAPKQKGLEYSVKKEKIAGKSLKVLCSSVMYGPNASGKTNIIGAMDTFRAIVLRGNIRNSENRGNPNQASESLELIPNISANCPKDVSFAIKFITEGMLVHYALSMDLGCFLDEHYERKITREELRIDDELVFSRNDKITLGSRDIMEKLVLKNSQLKHLDESDYHSIAEGSLNNKDLFLFNGFKVLFNQELVRIITKWFSDKFIVVYRADSLSLRKKLTDSKENVLYVDETTNNAAKLFGVNSNAIGYTKREGGVEGESELVSLVESMKDNKVNGAVINAEIFESYGTLRFVNIFPLILKTIATGSTLVVDELDASIHPMVLMNIINIFHNDDINKKGAQLIFNTHNPIFLNSNLFRRDEIKFVERDDSTNQSIIYSLSDFGTAGPGGVRKHDDYMKKYFVNQYGAIKEIDFTELFEDFLQGKKNN